MTIDGAAADAAQQIINATNGRRRLGGDRSGRLVGDGAGFGIDCLIRKGGKYIIVGLYGGGELGLSALPAAPGMRAITHFVGLLRRQPALGDAWQLIDLVRRTGLAADVPAATRPLGDVNKVMANDLRAGKLVGRAVLTPA